MTNFYTDENKKVHPLNNKNGISSDQHNNNDKKTNYEPPVSNPNVDWETAIKRYDSYNKNAVRDDRNKNFTFDPTLNDGYDFKKPADRMRFFNNYSIDGKPVYVVSLTNQIGETPTRELHSTFVNAGNQGTPVFFGRWNKILNMRRYTDISIPVSNRQTAISLADSRIQDNVVAIYNNGEFEDISLGDR